MAGMRTWVLLLVLCVGNLEALLVSSDPQSSTETPTEMSGTTAATMVTPGGAKKEEEEDDDNLSGVGEEIINVATGILKFVEAWDATTTPGTPTPGTPNGTLTETTEGANRNATVNAGESMGVRVEEGLGIWEGEGSGSGDDLGAMRPSKGLDGGKVLPVNLTRLIEDVANISGTVVNSTACLPVPSHWAICKKPTLFTLPNLLNHTSVEEVGAVLQQWAWLTRAGCHHSVEWFLCLLLAPRCPAPSVPQHLPCRSFCHVLQDSCWASLESGRLPVECHLLPEQAPCVSVSNWKGNPSGLECIP